MASPHLGPDVDGTKHPHETRTNPAALTDPEAGDDNGQLAYSVERVERVYRKIDRRIIPGEFPTRQGKRTHELS